MLYCVDCLLCVNVREYYLSKENLTHDFFLRRKMDSDGWIPVELLASFRRVRIHTGAVNTQLIVDVSEFHVTVSFALEERLKNLELIL